MLGENLAAFLRLYVQPVAAISQILDRGRLWFAIVLALMVALMSSFADPGRLIMQRVGNVMAQQQPASSSPLRPAENEAPSGKPPAPDPTALTRIYLLSSVSLRSLWAIAAFMIPAMIAARAFSGYGSFGVLMRQDYLSTLMCALIIWSAAYLPASIVAGVVSASDDRPALALSAFGVGIVYFLVLTTVAARTAFGVGTLSAVGLTAAGAFAAIVGGGLFGLSGFPSYGLASPLLLYYAWIYFGSDVRSLGDGLRFRQHFRNQLEIATNNPRDADAHYQLGLIYQKRRQFTEAIARFQRAVEIDPKEAEPHYQLGRIAREQGRFDDAIGHLTTAASLDEKLQQNEVWRELGAAYLCANRVEEAARALGKFVARREYDPEGLYWYGLVLKRTGRANEAREMFQRCVDSVKSMPSHRRAELRHWGSKAKREM